MKNINLNNLITTRVDTELDRVAIVGKNYTASYSDLVISCRDMHNKKVIVFIDDILSLIMTLVSIDGLAQIICPISTTTDSKGLYHLISKKNFDVVITDLDDEYLEIFKSLNIQILKFTDLDFNEKKINDQNNQESIWLIQTSGTTSLPKLVSHTLESLCAPIIKLKNAPKQNKIWGQFYDITRYAGYQVLFNSLLNGNTLVTSSAKDPISERLEQYSKERVTHISATPSQWRKILMAGEIAKSIPLEHIILGGEAADQKILNALSSFYPEAKITHTYASTEAGLSLFVSDRLAGFPMKFFDNSSDFSKISIRDGKLFLKTLSSAKSYFEGKKFKDLDGWVETDDIIEIQGDRFFIIGRRSGIINIGGDKVNPENVRQTLLKHSDVFQVNVFGKKNPITGMVLSANIQLRLNVDKELAKISIKNFIKENLQIKDQPRIIKFVDDIKIALTGKLGSKV